MKKTRPVITVAEAADAAVAALRSCGFTEVAAEVESAASAAAGGSKEALTKLHTMSHIKWLGDIYVKDPTWPRIVGNLCTSTASALGLPPQRFSARQK